LSINLFSNFLLIGFNICLYTVLTATLGAAGFIMGYDWMGAELCYCF
jgi:hypothetical protein